MANLNELFGTTNDAQATKHTLNGTAELTAKSSNYATSILNTIEASFDDYSDRVTLSMQDGNVLDQLITELIPFDYSDVEFLLALDDETVTNMLKSQQSKRSRAKGKAMTMDNYRTLLTAAVAEYLIRTATGKQKSLMSPRRKGAVEYTAEQLEAYAADQELLKKELRNVQSKKSIMKSKDGFDENDEAYQKLLEAEAALKARRIGGRQSVIEVEVDHTKDALAALLGDVDPADMKAADLRELLARVKELQ